MGLVNKILSNKNFVEILKMDKKLGLEIWNWLMETFIRGIFKIIALMETEHTHLVMEKNILDNGNRIK